MLLAFPAWLASVVFVPAAVRITDMATLPEVQAYLPSTSVVYVGMQQPSVVLVVAAVLVT